MPEKYIAYVWLFLPEKIAYGYNGMVNNVENFKLDKLFWGNVWITLLFPKKCFIVNVVKDSQITSFYIADLRVVII